MANNEREEEITFYLPVNFDKSGKMFMGLLDTWRFVQTAVVVGTLALLIFIAPINVLAKGGLALFVLIPILIVGLLGYNGLGLFDLVIQSTTYLKEKHFYSLKRVDSQEVNSGKEKQKQNWSRRPADSNKRSKKKKKQKNSKKSK